ncbi:hypothetical protein Zmor_028473 [Zophobas morio]|uniref:Uncharacterized protein n=1 Tax=Zophobas morio TaxID=2755281 RepID=A0AA38M318_9CUCU|nr:hypothetical protein Zmor_028473 [Zophobas morio]
MPGRKYHNFWSVGEFTTIKINSKVAAVCNICNKFFKNTSKQRLLAHRNICRRNNQSEAEDITDTEVILPEVENNDAAEITEEEEKKEERGAGGGNLSTQAQYQDANLEIQESVSEASTL